MNLKLTIEPKTNSTWGITLASRLPPNEWAKLANECKKEAGYRCEICGETEGVLQAHECWGYKDKERIQFLAYIECVCEMCHDVHHMGRSKSVYPKDYVKKLVEHWCSINGKTLQDFYEYESELFELNKKRAKKTYIVMVGNRQLI